MLSNYNKNEIIKRFPNIEFPFIKTIRNSTKADLYMLIPKGRKYFAWFTFLKGDNVCVFLEYNGNHITNCFLYNVCCSDDLFYGTILYGTLLKTNNQSFFSVENIFQYQHKWVHLYPLEKTLNILQNIFQNQISQVSYTKQCVVFGLPFMHTDYSKAVETISSLPYPIYSILHAFTKKPTFLQQKYFVQEAIFHVEADIKNDIYNLFYMKNNEKKFYDTALINDYKTSILMNKLFRNIKENENLDASEESDSEEEFEDTNEMKYMLNTCQTMCCEYLSQFKKWKPLRVSNDKNIIKSESLYLHKK